MNLTQLELEQMEQWAKLAMDFSADRLERELAASNLAVAFHVYLPLFRAMVQAQERIARLLVSPEVRS